MKSTKVKTVTLLTVLTLSTFASSAVFADEDFRLSNELGNSEKFEHLNTITSEEPAVEPTEPTNPSEPSTDDQSNPQTGNGTIVVPADPGTTPPPTTTVPTPEPGTTVPTPVDPGTTVPPTTSTQTPPVEPETTEPPTTITPTPEPQTKPDTTEPQTKPNTSTEPQAEPTPIEDNFNPFVSDKGQKIIGTEAGSIIIENVDGSTQKVAPEVIGAKTNSDGTITVKDAEGKLKRLPNTGEATSVLSVLGLAMLSLLGLAKKKKYI